MPILLPRRPSASWRRTLALLACIGAAHGAIAQPVPLTIEEAIYPGVTGIARTQDPVTVGVPLPDAWGVTAISQLGLSGAAAGQFRVLGRWPSGHVKWVLVDTLADVPAGGANTAIAVTDGAGAFGGPSLASDDGSTITVTTGAATFTVRKARFNVIDRAVVGATTIIAAGTSQGLVLTGPAPGHSTPPCATLYSSANDPASSATIEENGPVKAVIRAVGSHVDGAGNAYLHFTVRMTFYKNRSGVKITSVLRNADHGAANSFATAYKGLQAYEVRLTPALSGPLSYAIATEAAPRSGSLLGSDSAWLYQGQSQLMAWDDCPYQGAACANTYTSDVGYRVNEHGLDSVSGAAAQYPQGWADIRNAAGAGIEIGVYQLAAYWPKSLEFDAGGSDVRIGIWPRQNSQPIYQAWPAWSIHDVFVNVHASPIAPADDFAKFQHYLIGHADRAQYNAADVFPFAIPSASQEDAFYQAAGAAADPAIDAGHICCVQDYGITDYHWPLSVYRNFAWPQGGAGSQEEFRWSNLLNFIKRDHTGRFLNSAHFYRFQAEKAWPHADGASSGDSTVNGFHWRDRPHVAQAGAELDGLGHPLIAHSGDPTTDLDNSGKSFVCWWDTYHGHWYGMLDYYFMTGDETIRESITPLKDFYLNNDTYQGSPLGGAGLGAARAVAIEMIAASRLSEFLRAIGDADADGVLAQARDTFDRFVKPEPCISGWPGGCVTPDPDHPPVGAPYNGNDPPGVSRERGYPSGTANRGQQWCPSAAPGTRYIRGMSAFQASILEEGILSLRRALGPGWEDYQLSLDLAYGISQWALSECFSDNGSSKWFEAAFASGNSSLFNGFRYGIAADLPQICPTGTPITAAGNGTVLIDGSVYDAETLALPTQTVWMHFYLQHLVTGVGDWRRKLAIALQHVAAVQNITASDFGQYQIATLVEALDRPDQRTLITVPISGITDNGDGSYAVRWVVPAGAQSYVLRWGEKAVVESLQFEPLVSNAFGIDPAIHQNWWTAHLVGSTPAPTTPGSAQVWTIGGLSAGLTPAHFSLKAWVPAASAPHVPLRSNRAPQGTVGTGTEQTTLSLDTDIGATCRYATQPDVGFDDMSTSFATTGGVHHATPVAGLEDHHSYLYYVRCRSAADGAVDADDYVIGFTVGLGSGTGGAATSTGGVSTGGSGIGSSGSDGGTRRCGIGFGLAAIGLALLAAAAQMRGSAHGRDR